MEMAYVEYLTVSGLKVWITVYTFKRHQKFCNNLFTLHSLYLKYIQSRYNLAKPESSEHNQRPAECLWDLYFLFSLFLT